MTTPWDDNSVLAGQTITLYTISNVQDFVERVNDNYWTLEDADNFEDIRLVREKHGDVKGEKTKTIVPMSMVILSIEDDVAAK